MTPVLILTAAVFGALRPVLLYLDPGKLATDVYKDFAHLFVGGLFGAWLATWEPLLIWTFGILTVVEVACAGVKLSGKLPLPTEL